MFTRLKRLTTIFLVSLLSIGVMSCSSPSVQMYSKEQPKLDLATYFNGEIDAYGIFTDRSGEVVKRFKVLIKAKWEMKDGKRVGTLDEDFVYSDGTKQKRIWTLTEVAPGRYSGTASDVIGEAVGELAGNALNWRYTLALPVDGKTYHVQFNDWMYLMDDKVMLNKAEMSKFGIYLGEVTLAFYKR
ncbi:MAG: DUF3833 domain-containing protein [Burkholderiaceae bacterium]|jgi:hypothetical protein|nr:DUF3833 domain-containing protein [Polynucleobacter sp.]NBO86273.1 DUF3833 domain-containing protein [Burkholderiaceae bacterium]NCV65416.1 DUF3833 domain-containing protein [Burkholderiaceae bacterium]NCV78410.1 DUF3833 domain-containing protein [Burkholderiaceae bacterium]NCV94801.1 DUF3833 domain-containing protein [Burkholderiaceae bacterium]